VTTNAAVEFGVGVVVPTLIDEWRWRTV